MKTILILAYVFFLALYALGPIVLLLKRQADAAGGKKKLWKTYLALFGAGALATGAAYGLESALTALLSPDPETGFGCFINAFIVAGMTEETVKFIALMLFIYWSERFTRYARGASFASFVSLGFAFVENLLYVFSNSTAGGSLATAFFRAFTSIPGHFAFSIFMGYFVALAVLGKKKGENIFRTGQGFTARAPKEKKRFYKRLALGLGSAIGVHGLYDFLLMFAAVPTQLRGLSIVLWIVCFIGMYYAANELVEALKMKDHALRAAEREKQGDFYRIRTR